jgi:excisionase family DNA binding protein
MVIAVSTSLNEIDAVRASEAAELLGVSRARVSHMIRDNLLEGFRRGRDSYVTRDSVNARLADPRPAGRPRKKLTIA